MDLLLLLQYLILEIYYIDRKLKIRKALLTRAKAIFLWLDKKAVLIRPKIKNKNIIVKQKSCFLIINATNEELIHRIHCLENIFYQWIMIKKFWWFHKFLFYDSYFESYSLNVLKVSYLIKHICIHHRLLLQHHFHTWSFTFLCSLHTKSKYIFGFNPTNSLIAKPRVSSFISPTTNSFQLS